VRMRREGRSGRKPEGSSTTGSNSRVEVALITVAMDSGVSANVS